MGKIGIVRYTPEMADAWNEFVAESRNATFLLNRGFMDYHSDRFEDHSLLALKGEKIMALLPANIREEDGRLLLQSHGGLTYGGWLLSGRHPDAVEMLEIFELMREYGRRKGIAAVDYKPIPWIYASRPSDEEQYAVFRMGGSLTECNISCAIDLRDNPGLNKLQKRNLKRATALAPEIREESDVTVFHRMLAACLAERHGVAPVHTNAELQLLRDRFPSRIRVFVAYVGGEPQAGVCVFDTGRVAHAQYICSTSSGRAGGVLTYLFEHLITTVFSACTYFDFGICNESHGLILNEGLYRQKSSLGASAVAYPRYRLPL